ncbi:rab family member [Naegleria gruberi]|uniref:Rab family member n=1 Tax=Naegleria gruberi TaxID=5762 RepID=D2V1F9_NAEGR|nr:rab family member [Naegleria gruberi]EFC49159.1 rab family member [Naegleria gruberi]|eukprot:XP_002681903.1 rab family member [Naegleria gruberi strain NEG-M]
MGQSQKPIAAPQSAETTHHHNSKDPPKYSLCTRKEHENFIKLIAIKSSTTTTIENNSFKLNDEENSQFYLRTVLIREENKSWLERELPIEIIFEILRYLLPDDLIILSGVSWNFREVWTEHPFLWFSPLESGENYGKSLMSRKLVEDFINNSNNLVANWKQIYLQIGNVMMYPKSFSNFADQCVYGRIYGEYNTIQKIGFIGMKGCGKSTFCKLLATNKLDLQMKSTIGCDFYIQYLNLDLEENNQLIKYCFKLEIWDVSEMFRSVYRGLHVIYFCFDLSNEESLYHMINMFKDCCTNDLYINDLSNLENELDTDIVFLGLKKDSKTISNHTINNCIYPFIDRNVPYHQRRVSYFEVSAKEQDRTTFYPVSHIGFLPSKREHCFPLTPLTKDNEERFRNYGALD